MWEGFDRYLKTQEVGGKLAFDLREFQSSVEKQMRVVWEEIGKRVTDEQFQDKVKQQ
jgi:hypothetical protein